MYMVYRAAAFVGRKGVYGPGAGLYAIRWRRRHTYYVWYALYSIARDFLRSAKQRRGYIRKMPVCVRGEKIRPVIFGDMRRR